MGGEVEGSCRLGNILPLLLALESCSGDGLQWATGYLQMPRILCQWVICWCFPVNLSGFLMSPSQHEFSKTLWDSTNHLLEKSLQFAECPGLGEEGWGWGAASALYTAHTEFIPKALIWEPGLGDPFLWLHCSEFAKNVTICSFCDLMSHRTEHTILIPNPSPFKAVCSFPIWGKTTPFFLAPTLCLSLEKHQNLQSMASGVLALNLCPAEPASLLLRIWASFPPVEVLGDFKDHSLEGPMAVGLPALPVFLFVSPLLFRSASWAPAAQWCCWPPLHLFSAGHLLLHAFLLSCIFFGISLLLGKLVLLCHYPQQFFLLFFSVAAAKSLQSCPTLCDPIDGSTPGSPVPGILQARTLEWVAMSFSSQWLTNRSQDDQGWFGSTEVPLRTA